MSSGITMVRASTTCALAGGMLVASTADAAVRTFTMNWSPAASTESLFITIDNLATGPTSSATAVTGWDMQIESSNSGNVLKFTFPAYTGVPIPGNPNPFYGLMRLPGVTTGPGASISDGTIVQASSSFADSGPVTFGGQPGDWRLNSVNTFGFRFRSAVNSNVIHYGYARMFIGATPGQFRLVEFSYQDTGGAAIFVVPGPGALALLAAAPLCTRRRRRA